MLTIEKELTLVFHQKRRFWSKTLALSFLFALLIHAAGLLLFRVRPIALRQNEMIFPPVSVAMEAPVAHHEEIIAQTEEETLPNVRILPRPKKKLSVPLLPRKPLPPAVAEGFSRQKFSLNFPAIKDTRPYQAHLTLLGGLAGRKLIRSEFQLERNEAHEACCYAVTVDDRTGKILWIDPLDEISAKLSHMEFEKKKNGSITKGEMEVCFK